MQIGEITEKYFLSPKQAIKIIGPLSFGTDWQHDLPLDHPHMQGALRNLYKALQSGTVSAFHHAFDGHERQLTAAQAGNEFFKIDVKRDCCFFGPIVGPPNELKIVRSELITFLENHRLSLLKSQKPDPIQACKNWLIEKLSAPDRTPTNKELEPKAFNLFPDLSGNGYRAARKLALSELNDTRLRKGGRPKGTTKNYDTPSGKP